MFKGILLPSLAFASVVAQLQLNVTAVSARDGSSTLECWEVDSPFYMSSDTATAGAIDGAGADRRLRRVDGYRRRTGECHEMHSCIALTYTYALLFPFIPVHSPSES